MQCFFIGSDGCEDGITGRFETTQSESHRQPQQQIQESTHVRQLQSPVVVKQDSMSSFLHQQPFGIFGQGEFFKFYHSLLKYLIQNI